MYTTHNCSFTRSREWTKALTIPEGQLATWARYVDAPQSRQTADIIRNELRQVGTSVTTTSYEVYLQGSYRNHTNIFRDSDVDLVVELEQTFYSDVSLLTPDEQQLRERSYPPATLTLQDFRNQVLRQLRRRFGDLVEDGNKAIKVGGLGERLNADVLVCAEHRDWKYFYGTRDDQHSFVPGVVFWTQRENREVVNYPKVHYENGVAKQQSSRDWFKPTVRMVKNARRLMYDRGTLPRGTAPSYFIQCFLFNVPDGQFGNTQQQNYRDVLAWLEAADLTKFVCQHGQYALFGSSPEQWDIDQARLLIRGLRHLWDNWY
jgi:hypothetical protein